MKWQEVIATVAAETGTSKAQARRTLEAFKAVITDELARGGRVPLPGLGTWSTRDSSERTVRSIESGRKMWIASRTVPHFRCAKAIKERLRASSDRIWRNPDHQKAWRLSQTLLADVALYNKEARPEIAPDADADAVHASCAATFGEDWEQVVSTFQSKVPQTVRDEHDHLASSARRIWGRSS